MTRTVLGTTLAASILGSGGLLAGTGGSAEAASAPISRSAVKVHFDLASGQMPENVVLDREGSVDVTLAGARQVARITADGETQVLATLPAPADPKATTPLLGFPLTTGLVREKSTFYVVYATGSAAETGVWTFAEGHSPRKLADLPADGLPNGMEMNRRTGALYVTDSAKGAVYRVSTRGTHRGTATVFSAGAALSSTGFFGANGVKIHGQGLYVSNLDRGTVLRTPLNGRAAGTFETVASNLAGIDDFAFTGKGEQFLASLVTKNEVVLVNGTGERKTVLSAADGLSNPTSVAIRGTTVYVPSAAYTTQKDPNLLVAHLARR